MTTITIMVPIAIATIIGIDGRTGPMQCRVGR